MAGRLANPCVEDTIPQGDTALYNALISACGAAGQVDRVVRFLDDMEKQVFCCVYHIQDAAVNHLLVASGCAG